VTMTGPPIPWEERPGVAGVLSHGHLSEVLRSISE
jgi:hypothetical protein